MIPTSPESQQMPRSDKKEENAESQNEAKVEEDKKSLRDVEPSPAATELEKTERAKQARKDNNGVVLDWLIKNIGLDKSDKFYIKFKEVLEKKLGQDTEEMDQAAEFLQELPKLFEQIDGRINTLSKDKTKYDNIKQKRVEIIKGICEPILAGHLSSEDATALVTGIELVNKDDPTKQALFRDAGIRSGYEGVMFYNTKEHKIYIFDGSLVDNYVNENNSQMKLDIRHMITHEMSHGIVESATKYNKTLVAEAKKIIGRAKTVDNKFADSQSQHIRNSLDGVKNAESDFGKYFADELSKKPAFVAMSDEQKAQFEKAEKIKFVSDREIQAAAEILAEYTAMYLQSDGTLEDFVLTCLKKSDPESIKSYLGEKFTLQKINAINKITSPETKKLLLKDLGEGFSELTTTYQVFYDEIKKVMVSSKGKFGELISGQNNEEDPFGEYSGDGYADGSAGFSGQDQNATQGDDSVLKEFGALIKAIGDEVPNIK